ncbi:MAG TPA: hypoxanthine phosphoribosyltransferase [Candidatus Corynebacterium avicola]|uniref:Hypoxanthine phosphoribosyltransferase n=1 Tax=Candidatus Corynebacterium avicola TaxID=2838527 RepID=A0A9D1RQQ3_9CORY|nr:hypoxanthine phosphoribosyltransferase [Candidatus Corynebacterium avicola]
MISKKTDVPDNCYGDDVDAVLVDKTTLHARIAEMATAASDRYRDEDEDTILVCVLKGATYFIADFARAMDVPTQMEFMVVSSYGTNSESSGNVEIIMDLKRDIRGRNVIILEDIIESGITLSWLVEDLKSRQPKNLEVITLLRKPEAVQKHVDATDVGFEIPNDFVVGYGLDYAERYRDLPWVGTLRPSVYS